MTRLAASLIQVGGITLLSRILGFARDLLVARLFGADAGTDAFFVAFKVPNFFRRLFAEGAFASVLVPVLHEAEHRGGREELRRLLDSLSGVLGAGVLLMTLVGLLIAPILILAFAPGFAGQPARQDLAAELLRLTLPYVAFVVLAALAGAVLNLRERFGIPAFTPVLLNLAIIGCALWLAPRLEQPILALGWGVLFGGLIQLAVQLPFLARLGLLPRPRLGSAGWHAGTRQFLRRLGPVVLGVSVTQINLLIDTFLASFLAAGSISWLYYADRLVEFPLGILGAALGIVILPHLSRQAAMTGGARKEEIALDVRVPARASPETVLAEATGPGSGGMAHAACGAAKEIRDPPIIPAHHSSQPRKAIGPFSATAPDDFSATLDWALRWVLLLGLPAAVGLVVLAEPLVATLFLSTEFSARDVRMAALSLMAYAAGLVAFMAIKVLAQGYYARHDVRTPARFALIALGTNLSLSLALMGIWAHAGLALATSLAAWVNAGLLLWGLGRSRAYRLGRDERDLILKSLTAVFILGALLSWGSPALDTWLAVPAGTRLGWLGAWILVGAGSYLAAILALGVRV
ncbi:MAG: murein biosynthesis integral membrane protein MurJ, partial [Gammaproteobacteria bacterium]